MTTATQRSQAVAVSLLCLLCTGLEQWLWHQNMPAQLCQNRFERTFKEKTHCFQLLYYIDSICWLFISIVPVFNCCIKNNRECFCNLSLGSIEGGEKSTGKLADAVHPGWRMNRCPRLEMIQKVGWVSRPLNELCVWYRMIFMFYNFSFVCI